MRSLVLPFMLSLCNTALAGENLDISAGTLELGGNARAVVVAGGGSADVLFVISPSVGYFVTDNLQLNGGVSIVEASGVTGVAAQLGTKYLFGSDGLRPYVGGQFFAADGSNPVVGAVGGLLVPLSSAVALDVGAEFNLVLGQGMTLIDVPIGAMGVRAFF